MMILRDRNRVPFLSIWIHPVFWCVRLAHLLSVLCRGVLCIACIVYVLCLVCQMLPIYLHCPFLIAPSTFSNVYLFRTFEALIYSLTTIEWKQRKEHASQIVSVEWFHQRTVSPSVMDLAFLAGDMFIRPKHSLSASVNVLPDRSVRVLLCVGKFMM
jgi:hypothetical protein